MQFNLIMNSQAYINKTDISLRRCHSNPRTYMLLLIFTVFQCNIGLWKRQKPCHKSPDHEYENITRNRTAIIEESYKTSWDNKVEKMEDNVAYSIHNTTLMTMTDCEAYGVPKTQKIT